jgi:hypothetical protein
MVRFERRVVSSLHKRAKRARLLDVLREVRVAGDEDETRVLRSLPLVGLPGEGLAVRRAARVPVRFKALPNSPPNRS